MHHNHLKDLTKHQMQNNAVRIPDAVVWGTILYYSGDADVNGPKTTLSNTATKKVTVEKGAK